MIDNKTVLITGGAGFIGSNLCEVLLQQNNKVICMDNFLTEGWYLTAKKARHAQ